MVVSEVHGEKTQAAKRIHKLHRCAQESKRVDGRADDRKQEELHLKVPHPKIRRDARLLRVLGSLIETHVRTTRKSRLCSTVRSSALHPSDCWDEERGGGSSDVFVSNPPVPQILPELHVEIEMMSVPEDAMKAQPDVEMETESVRRGTTRTSSTWENCADTINMEVWLDATGKCRRYDADEVQATVAGVMQECEVFKWRRKYKRSSTETIISTIMSHKAKRDSPAKNCDTGVRRCNACVRALHEHPMHTNAEVDDQQNGVKVSHTSTKVMRYVIRVPS